jgi:hypothetical protein
MELQFGRMLEDETNSWTARRSFRHWIYSRGPQVGTYLDEQVMDANAPCWVTRGTCTCCRSSWKLEEEGDQMDAECLGKSDGTGNEPSAPLTVNRCGATLSKKFNI